MAGRRILIAGVSSFWGAELARALEHDPDVEHVIGLDTKRPSALGGTEFLEADIRGPDLISLLPETGVDTVVHCGILLYPEPGKPTRALHDINVIGTLQLLAACEKIPTLSRLVVRGSAAIYGSEPAAPGFFSEDMARRYPLRTRFQRDVGELEGYFENFARRRSDVTCCMLRYQPEIGPGVDTPLCRYLALPVVPTQLGFDPRLQLLHVDDARGALLAAVRQPVAGPVNVAPPGSVSLTRILRLAGKITIPIVHPLFGVATSRLARRLGAGDVYTDGVRLLRYGRSVAIDRLRGELGYEPAYDAVAAVKDHLAREGAGPGKSGQGAPATGPTAQAVGS